MSQKLTPKLIRKLFPEQNSKEIDRLDVSAKDIVEVHFQLMLCTKNMMSLHQILVWMTPTYCRGMHLFLVWGTSAALVGAWEGSISTNLILVP